MSKEVVKGAKITIILDDDNFVYEHNDVNENIIDAAQEADIDVPFSCMAGVCSSCRAKLLEGEVVMEDTHSLTEEEIKEGYILTCQAKPVTSKVVISFDEVWYLHNAAPNDESQKQRFLGFFYNLSKSLAMSHVLSEIKASCANPDEIRQILLKHNARFVGKDHQIDTYFVVPSGRLKLREGDIENTLIFYDRVEVKGIKQSFVKLYHPPKDVAALKIILEKSMDVLVVVDKVREIYFIDNVKFHIDQVQGLGSFMEIEAIGKEGEYTEEELSAQCQQYIALLQVDSKDFIAHSYSDLIMAKKG